MTLIFMPNSPDNFHLFAIKDCRNWPMPCKFELYNNRFSRVLSLIFCQEKRWKFFISQASICPCLYWYIEWLSNGHIRVRKPVTYFTVKNKLREKKGIYFSSFSPWHFIIISNVVDDTSFVNLICPFFTYSMNSICLFEYNTYSSVRIYNWTNYEMLSH